MHGSRSRKWRTDTFDAPTIDLLLAPLCGASLSLHVHGGVFVAL